MEAGDALEPERRDADGKTDQQRFDDEVARATHRAVLVLGGVGVFAALVMSTIALVNSSGANVTTVTVPAAQAAGANPTAGKPPSPLTGDALGTQLFVSGNPDTGAIGCGSCHTMKAAGANGTIGPNLDKELSADPVSATLTSIVDPNSEIVPGYSANVMPTNYGTALTKQELDALARYIYHSTNAKAKAKAKAGAP